MKCSFETKLNDNNLNVFFQDDATLILLTPSDPTLKDAASTVVLVSGSIGSGARSCSSVDGVGGVGLLVRHWQRILDRWQSG